MPGPPLVSRASEGEKHLGRSGVGRSIMLELGLSTNPAAHNRIRPWPWPVEQMHGRTSGVGSLKQGMTGRDPVDEARGPRWPR